MNRRHAIALLILGFFSAVLAARAVRSPGYMDADYYYAMGIQWARGQGGQEPFLWNYLSDPEEIPTPSHAYWSPLTSMLSGLSMSLFGVRFQVAQIPFIVATALLPLLVWRLALAFGVDQAGSLLAGMLVIGPGFFLPFFVTTDAFSYYALLGGLLLLLMQTRSERYQSGKWLLAGCICGLAHLSRADGFLLLIIPLSMLLISPNTRLRDTSALVLGYLLVMAPWMTRNQLIFGSPLASGGSRMLWLRTYDELFSYPGETLSFQRWWASGLDRILFLRWESLKILAQRIIAENGLVFLLPFMIIGIIQNWNRAIVRSTIYYLAALLILMGLVFPLAGARGGWFHSSTAAMPLLWVMAAVGLKTSVDWAGQRRDWNIERSRTVFSVVLVIFALLLTWGLLANRVYGRGQEGSGWNIPSARYHEVYEAILAIDSKPGVIAINNPPGFYHVSGLPSVVLPAGDVEVLKEVVDRYGVAWVVIDRNHPVELEGLYQQTSTPPWLEHEKSLSSYGERFNLYRVKGD